MKNFIIEFPQIQLNCELKQNCIKTQPKIVHNEIQLGVNIQGLFQQISGLHEFDQSLSSNIATNYWDKYQTAYAIENASHIKIEIVQVLPPIAQAEEYTLYLLAKTNPQIGDYYEEYMKINNAWQKIGQTTVDLSNYYDKTQTDALLSAKADINDVPSAISQLINDSGYLSSQIDPIYSSQKFNIVFQGDNITRLVNDAGYLTSQTDPIYTADKSSLALKSELSNYLPLSGGTLSGDIIIKTDYDKLTNTSYKNEAFKFFDINGKTLTTITHILDANHNNYCSIRVNNPNDTSDSDIAYMYVSYYNNGAKIITSNAIFTNCLANTQAKTDSSTKIATTQYVKNNLDDYLKLASGGSISGALTINSLTNNKFIIQNNYDKLTNTSYKEEAIKYFDVNGKTLVTITHILNDSHNNSCSIRVNNPNATSDSDYVYLTVQYTDAGTKRILTDATITQGYATTQSTSTNNTTLATTAFVHNVVNAQIGNINSILDAINGEVL